MHRSSTSSNRLEPQFNSGISISNIPSGRVITRLYNTYIELGANDISQVRVTLHKNYTYSI